VSLCAFSFDFTINDPKPSIEFSIRASFQFSATGAGFNAVDRPSTMNDNCTLQYCIYRAIRHVFVKPITYAQREWRMKKKDLKFFEELLNNRLQELLNQADNTVSGMTEQKENFPDPTDRATLESDRNFMLRIRDREHKLIKKIKKALDRIENNTFGICESCGEDISVERLKARPVTTQCIDCKTKEEAFEKALGL
jgi:DnaK suppressor protein